RPNRLRPAHELRERAPRRRARARLARASAVRRRAAPARSRSSLPEVVAVVEREAHSAQQTGEDPETDRDLRLGPRLHLEMVVDRRNEEDASTEALERED